MGYECEIWYIDMIIYHIDMVILDVDKGYGLMIWEMTVSIRSSPISIWNILSLCSRPYPTEGTGLPRHYVQLLAPDPTWMCNGRSARWKVAHLEGGKCSSRGRHKDLFSNFPFHSCDVVSCGGVFGQTTMEVVSIICSLALARQRCYSLAGYSPSKVFAWP